MGVILLMCLLGIAFGQDEFREYMPITGADEQSLGSLTDLQLLDLAAKANERIIIRIGGPSQAVIAQEGVNASFDCLPWLRRFPGGSIQWQSQDLTNDLVPTGNPTDLNPPGDGNRIAIGGPFNRWYNLTSVVVVTGAEESDLGIILCMVCIGRDTIFEECHTANTTLIPIGAPPVIISSLPGDDPIRIQEADPDQGLLLERDYNVGANFCIRRGSMEFFSLKCGLFERPTPQPNPSRTWLKDGVEIYTVAEVGAIPEITEFIMNRLFLMPGFVTPSVFTPRADGSLDINTQVSNSTLVTTMDPVLTTNEAVVNAIFNFALGNWTCLANNSLGTSVATTIVRQCGAIPQVPRCVGTLFPLRRQVVPLGCVVCIPRGTSVVLDCTAVAGDPPINYLWRDGEGRVISRHPQLVVREEGSYSCDATNIDAPTNRVVSVLAFSPRARIMTSIEGRKGNGCERLRLPPGETINADICIFFGETLRVNCTTFDTNVTLQLEQDGVPVFNATSIIIGATDQNVDEVNVTFSCRLASVTGPCGEFTFDNTIQVFDPARIVRQGDELTAGVSPGVVQRDENTTFTLTCLATGVPDIMTNWYRVRENNRGMLMEVLIVDGADPRFTLSGDDEDLRLTITQFRRSDEGTYVCRTTNIAGEDADVVSLTTDFGSGVWTTTAFSDCNILCEEGVRKRSVTCRNSRYNNILPDIRCVNEDPRPRPNVTESCATLYPFACFLDPVWIPGPWGLCTRGCQGGYRQRDVVCQVPMTGEIKPDYVCNYIPKPATYENCPNTCCFRDLFPSACRRANSVTCTSQAYRQVCCWSCGLTFLEHQ